MGERKDGNMRKEFVADVRAYIAIMFGIVVFAMVAAGGIAIDMQRRNVLKAGVQEAADVSLTAAARHKSKHPSASDDQITASARNLFDDSMKRVKDVNDSSFTVKFDRVNSKFVLDFAAFTKTLLLGAMGDKYLSLNTHSGAKLGKPPIIELSMALDTIGSIRPALAASVRATILTMLKTANMMSFRRRMSLAGWLNVRSLLNR